MYILLFYKNGLEKEIIGLNIQCRLQVCLQFINGIADGVNMYGI